MSEMTSRERFQAVMHFEPGVRTLMWEWAYWAGTLDRWHTEGLRRTQYSLAPGLPTGLGVYAEAVPFPHPTQNRYRDVDVHQALGFDDGTVRIPLLWRFCPQATPIVVEEDESTITMIDGEGLKVRQRKDRASVPDFLDGPVQDRAGWEQVKRERFGPDIMARFPPNWPAVAESYRDRDYPLGLQLEGFFWTPRELLGVVNHLMMYHDDPWLMHDIGKHLCDLWLAMLEEVVAKVQLDFVYISEDMAYKNHSMISPRMFAEFIAPYYRRLTGFLRAHGVDVIFVDTDGDCSELIPLFVETGVSGFWPFEVQAGMEIVEVRKKHPRLLIQGGLDKTKVALGRAAIDAELEAKLPILLSQGGFIPCCDHQVPPDVPWEHFRYYREKLKEYIFKYQSK